MWWIAVWCTGIIIRRLSPPFSHTSSDLSQTHEFNYYTEYDVHTDAHTLSWEWGRELHTTALLIDLLAFTLYMSSVFTTFFVPSLCWSSSLDFLCSTLSAGSVLSHRERPQNFNIYYQLSGSCHGINSYCIWWRLNEMKLGVPFADYS